MDNTACLTARLVSRVQLWVPMPTQQAKALQPKMQPLDVAISQNLLISHCSPGREGDGTLFKTDKQTSAHLPQQALVFGEQASTVLHGHVQSPPVELHEGDGELKPAERAEPA